MTRDARTWTATRRPAAGNPRRQRGRRRGALTWTTMPEQLRRRGVSWKVYTGRHGRARRQRAALLHEPTRRSRRCRRAAWTPTTRPTSWPTCAAGALPQVSWVLVADRRERAPAAPVALRRDAPRADSSARSRPTRRCGRRRRCSSPGTRTAASSTTSPPPTAPPGHARRVIYGATLPGRAGRSAGRSASASACRCSSSRRSRAAASSARDASTTPRCCASSRRRFGAEVPNLSAWRRARHRRPDVGLQLRAARPETAVAPARRPAPEAGPARRLRRRGAGGGRARAHARAGAGAGAAAVGLAGARGG